LQNILIVCADQDLRKDLSRVLATELKFLYVDVDEVLDFEILNQQNVAMIEAKDVLKSLERKSIDRVLNFNNCIITMSRDLFVSNDNFLLMKHCQKVFLELPKAYFVARNNNGDVYKLEQELALFDKINKLVTINCDITIDKNIQSVQELSKSIIDKLKKA
jgi:shikimate kinase